MSRVRLGRRRRLTAVAVLVLAGLAGACSTGGGLRVTAGFTDVGSLAPQAPVMMNDVKVGEVVDIRLEGDLAVVTMKIDPEADVPQGVVARVRSTSLLGERIVDLVIPDDLARDAPALRDGMTIRDTAVRAELEDLVREGSDVLAPIAASEVATLVDEGAEGFGGRGPQLRRLLSDLEQIVHAYSTRTDDLRSIVSSLNEFNSTLARVAGAHAQAVVNTDRAISMLNEESARLERAIESLATLSRGARGILDAHSDEMDRFFSQLRTISGVLAGEQRTIELLLRYAPRHNRNTQIVEFEQMNQIFQDFVLCGFNDDPADPARSCGTADPGERS